MHDGTIAAGLVGVTGYTGMELLRLAMQHPALRLVRATSRAEAGNPLARLFPHLQATPLAGLVVSEPDMDDLAKECELVFLAVPHGTAMELGAALLERGVRVIDLSADFRLRDKAVYESWYGLGHTRPDALAQAVYGLPEIYGEQVRGARLVANPGCYPTSVILALYPALKERLILPDDVVADCKSGTTGAGRSAKVGSLFCEVADTFKAYNLAKHRHTPEIEQEISLAAGRPMTISFNTHLLPIGRGILSTIYTKLSADADVKDIHAAYADFYEPHPWVRVLPLGTLPETRWVRGTNFCDIGLVKDPRTGRLIVLSAIDNLCRGASGQAVVNANLMFGLAEGTGLSPGALLP
jgi:N-acetyl-gamma-glutamyl-phosphate reductase